MDKSNEDYVRRRLGEIERTLRVTALRVLAEWDSLNIPSPSLFPAIAAISNPSFGAWNGLILSIFKARESALRSSPPEVRARIMNAKGITAIHDWMSKRIGQEKELALGPLVDISRAPSGQKLAKTLELSIALRNRIVHDDPIDPSWWERAAKALEAVVNVLEQNPIPVLGNKERQRDD